MLYSTRMDRGGDPGQVTESFEVAVKKTVRFGFDQCFFKAGIFDFLSTISKFKCYQFH